MSWNTTHRDTRTEELGPCTRATNVSARLTGRERTCGPRSSAAISDRTYDAMPLSLYLIISTKNIRYARSIGCAARPRQSRAWLAQSGTKQLSAWACHGDGTPVR